jgi:hypothetical protein
MKERSRALVEMTRSRDTAAGVTRRVDRAASGKMAKAATRRVGSQPTRKNQVRAETCGSKTHPIRDAVRGSDADEAGAGDWRNRPTLVVYFLRLDLAEVTAPHENGVPADFVEITAP